MKTEAVQKQSKQSTLVLKQFAKIEAQVKQTFDSIAATKNNLKRVINAYNYMLEGTQTSKLDQAIEKEMAVLRKYEARQEQLIKLLQSKKTNNELKACAYKLPGLSNQIEEALGRDELLKLLVDIDLQLQQLEKRKQKISVEFEQKKKYLK